MSRDEGIPFKNATLRHVLRSRIKLLCGLDSEYEFVCGSSSGPCPSSNPSKKNGTKF
jgi:hypothetical protein